MCGWGRTSWLVSGISITGPKWSKKMKGPTLRWRAAGSSLRTTRPPPRSFSWPVSRCWTGMGSGLQPRRDVGDSLAEHPRGRQVAGRHVAGTAVRGRLRDGAAVRHEVVDVVALGALGV